MSCDPNPKYIVHNKSRPWTPTLNPEPETGREGGTSQGRTWRFPAMPPRVHSPPTAFPSPQVEFPEGNLIGIAKEQLPVVVTFKSDKPLSFTANIEFLDEDGKRYSVAVTATADNCLLSHQVGCSLGAELPPVQVSLARAQRVLMTP